MTVVSTVQQDVDEISYHATARFRIRILSTLSTVGAVCLLAVAASQYSSVNVGVSYHVNPKFVAELDIILIILLSFAIIWDAANFAHDRIAHRSIRPGARVAVELLEWLCFVVSAVVVLAETIAFYQNPLEPATATPIGLQYFGVAMVFITCVPMFILFVYACRETHLRRRRRMMAAMVLESKAGIELSPTMALSVPAPVIVACNCQEEIYDNLVAGASNDQPPEYPSAAREMHVIEQGKSAAAV